MLPHAEGGEELGPELAGAPHLCLLEELLQPVLSSSAGQPRQVRIPGGERVGLQRIDQPDGGQGIQ
ncbi:hypothetical protein [Sorangium sp. So ce128]|uniref:hypothetical protein n=1 Tax=Sorangium sp. So ce128 TaxID=3133281 RepID=UPI003F5DD9AB